MQIALCTTLDSPICIFGFRFSDAGFVQFQVFPFSADIEDRRLFVLIRSPRGSLATMSSSEIISGFPTARGLTVERWSAAEISKLVASTKWGDAMTGKEVELLARYLHVCRAEKGAVIVREGGREAYLCLIVQGHSSIVKGGKKIGDAGADRVVGEMSLIDGEPRSASVVADEPTLFLVLTTDDFNRLSSEVPRVAVKLLLKISKLISQRLRQTSGALVEHLG